MKTSRLFVQPALRLKPARTAHHFPASKKPFSLTAQGGKMSKERLNKCHSVVTNFVVDSYVRHKPCDFF